MQQAKELGTRTNAEPQHRGSDRRLMGERLRVGIVGLGRLWEARYKPAFQRQASQLAVTTLFDQVASRAAWEARQLGIVATTGLTELVESPEVDVVYLLAPQWFGLHALELACTRGKPVFCALSWSNQLDELQRVAPSVSGSKTPVMFEMPRRFYPASMRLRELLATHLGKPRLVLGQARLSGFDRQRDPGPDSQLAPASLLFDPGCNLIDWCRFVFEAEPESIAGSTTRVLPDTDVGADDFEDMRLSFANGSQAHIWMSRYHHHPWGEALRFLPPSGLQVYAEQGAAFLEMPDRVRWSDAAGSHDEQLPMTPSVGEQMNEHFRRLVAGQANLAPSLDDALAVARLVRRLRESHTRSAAHADA